jgi:D-alanine-D-alanine ligase
MKRLRILALIPEGQVPPETLEGLSDSEFVRVKMEYDVLRALERAGHDLRTLDVTSDLGAIRRAIKEHRPHLAFNMLEGFHGVPVYDHHVVSYLELMRTPYSGCNPRGLMLSRDKELAKKILKWHAVPVPAWRTYPYGRKVRPPKVNTWPRIVKSATDESSTGISQASVVHSEEELVERVRFMHEHHGGDVMVEDYIDGREIYIGVMGNTRLQVFPPWELFLEHLREDAPRIATARLKFDVKYQKKIGASTRLADALPDGLAEKIPRLAKRVYRALSLSGYARLDFRLDGDGKLYLLEANPNPDLSSDEDFARSAKESGLDYDALIARIVGLGVRYRAEWKVNEE